MSPKVLSGTFDSARIWSTVFSPSPSMSICLRPANQISFSRIWAGHSGLMHQRPVSSSVDASGGSDSTGPPHSGHTSGGAIFFAFDGRLSSTTPTTYGMISPAFSISTVSPMRMSFLRIWP